MGLVMDRAGRPLSGRRVVKRCLAVVERGLFLVGVLCLVAWGVACARTSLYQARQAETFDRVLAGAIHAEDHDLAEWSAARVGAFAEARGTAVRALGRLEVPTGGISVMVLEGTDDRTLDRAAGHIEGTPPPGGSGNAGIAGHRDGFFRGLRHVEPGDEIVYTTLEGVGRYEVEGVEIVEPRDVYVLDPTGYSALTLVTCYPFYFVGDAPRRFVVHARRVSYEAWRDDASAVLASR